MKNILITGGAGFIGSNLAHYLKKRKNKVIVVDDLSVGNRNNLNKNILFYKKDINKISSIKKIKKIDIIIHLAAKAEILIEENKELKYHDANLNGLQATLNFAAKKKIKKFIFASSASIYGDSGKEKVNENKKINPKHFYAYTKYIGEEMVKTYGHIKNFKYVNFRFFNIYGKSSNAVIAKFLAQKIQNKKITIYGNGKQKRDFVHIDDLCDAILKAIKNNKYDNSTYNLGSGKAISINDLKRIISSKNDHVFLDKRNDDIEISIANINKIYRNLKWRPRISFIKGISKMMIEDYKRLKKLKIPSVQNQINLIKNFNKTIK
jgi:UDP-glucose 4-epimerase